MQLITHQTGPEGKGRLLIEDGADIKRILRVRCDRSRLHQRRSSRLRAVWTSRKWAHPLSSNITELSTQFWPDRSTFKMCSLKPLAL
jgi:hypothetical protein